MGERNGSRAHLLIIWSVVLTALSTLSFLGRIWGRILSTLAPRVEDLLMTLAMIGAWGITADNLLSVSYGAGRHSEYVSNSDLMSFLKTLYAYYYLQVGTTTLIKAAILLLYHHTFPTPKFRLSIYIVGAVVLADAVALFIAFGFECRPIAAVFDPNVRGNCYNRTLFTALVSATLLLTDTIIYVMPMPIIFRLNTTIRKKLGLAMVFALGAVICLARIVQIVDSARLDQKDLTWSNTNVAIWNLVEVHLGCVAANVPLMGPLFYRINTKLRLSERLHSTWPGLTTNASSEAEHGLKAHHTRVEDGFQRMTDFNPRNNSREGTSAPSIRRADSSLFEPIELGYRGSHEILVRTDLDQTGRLSTVKEKDHQEPV